ATNVHSRVFAGLPAGSFTVAVTDANGCVYHDTIDLVEPAPIAAGINAAPAVLACYGDTNGVVTATGVSGGSGSYPVSLHY
uniref:hypothetical protein n=1 Tax=Psychroserpens mesophilus TaxID=325473 RepID=UPI003D64C03D